jgi:hypothetical protein
MNNMEYENRFGQTKELVITDKYLGSCTLKQKKTLLFLNVSFHSVARPAASI